VITGLSSYELTVFNRQLIEDRVGSNSNGRIDVTQTNRFRSPLQVGIIFMMMSGRLYVGMECMLNQSAVTPPTGFEFNLRRKMKESGEN